MSDNFYEQLFSVRGKVALVTGGTRGIGMMIAEGLTRCGARVYISSRKEDACADAQTQLSKFGECIAIPGDISSVEGCEKLAGEISDREPQLDLLVNNAGLTWGANIEEFPEKGWDKVMDLDVQSPFFLTQKLLPLLKEAASPGQRSVIVNISSVNAIRAGGLQNYSYVAAKAGLNQLSVEMARDLMQHHINVNVIAPGPFKSKMTAPLYATPELEQKVTDSFLMKRWGAMEDVAGLTVMFASKAGSYLTGTIVACDGGATSIGG
jgi:NAD(P)-dependent dehydrogenase (short-subunit alcohol dehydrogenase family)